MSPEPYVNVSLPRFPALIRDEFLFDHQEGEGNFTPCLVFGLASIPGRCLTFHVLTDSGAQIGRLPIHALAFEECEAWPLTDVELWDCFSPHPSVHAFEHLDGLRCAYRRPDKAWVQGEYLFTVDWAGDVYSEDPGDLGWKSAHVIRCDTGHLAAQPNNRMVWYDPSWIVDPWPEREVKPRYRTMTRTWSCEAQPWRTEDTAEMLYEVETP